jgi:hypothetical protein
VVTTLAAAIASRPDLPGVTLLDRMLLLADRQVKLVAPGADAGKLDRSVWSDGDVK